VETAPENAEAHDALALGHYLEHQGLRAKFRLATEVRHETERTL
jgi:hypothetical protein